MSNLEFARAQARDTKVKLHGADAFAGMEVHINVVSIGEPQPEAPQAEKV